MNAAFLIAADQVVVHHGWFPFFPLFPLFLVAMFVVVSRRVAWRRWGSAGPSATGESVLAERYARGEIDESEFRHRRDVLRNVPDPSHRRRR